ncbi:MAG: FAD-dependent oxidoreductase [Spirochaetales bacterium]|nr:FAD-dependent oxidoreductase [Spirochaetales bacterium]
MKALQPDVVVIGGGAAGMSAALTLAEAGFPTAVIEREPCLGGILHQCIHNGFGVSFFNEELTGPEFALRLDRMVEEHPLIQVYLAATVTDIQKQDAGFAITAYSKAAGALALSARAVILAMGSRERNRGNIPIPGTRPAGIFTAGLAQRLLNIEGISPGRRAVIIGSGDIGLIMARRLTWTGLEVLGVVEIQPYPAGLTRNIVQCLHDFRIPLYLSHVVSRVYGRDRVTGVEIRSLEKGGSFFLSCDTLLLSVGLIPENELSRQAGVVLDKVTRGALVDSRFMTNVEGVFSCGNVLHIHDLVDYCAMEAQECARGVGRYLKGDDQGEEVRIISGTNVRYTVPQSLRPGRKTSISLRSLIVANPCVLTVSRNGTVLKQRKLLHVQPSEMIRMQLDEKETGSCTPEDRIEVAIT